MAAEVEEAGEAEKVTRRFAATINGECSEEAAHSECFASSYKVSDWVSNLGINSTNALNRISQPSIVDISGQSFPKVIISKL